MATRSRFAISVSVNYRRRAAPDSKRLNVRGRSRVCKFLEEDDMVRLFGRTLAACASAAVLVFVCSSTVNAQAVKGGLLGNIVDQSGFALPGVTVTITEVNTNISYSAVTNESGYYIFSNLKDGKYRVTAELSGFKRIVRDGVDVPVNATLRADLNMQVQAIQASVTRD